MTDLKKGLSLNEPKQAELGSDNLHMLTDERTDFWRETYYGFTRDSGHFLSIETGDGFTAQVRIRAKFEHLYDQAGIMVRIDEL